MSAYIISWINGKINSLVRRAVKLRATRGALAWVIRLARYN